ncbi:DUF5681 domain-containing protein [Variovorax ureilyticus]|uniref:DUF5681 domain-containing protein n=1 Tax=Variovorax ureilyticus TaxID=1836198 RepID=A0ABU8VIF9_9BURK
MTKKTSEEADKALPAADKKAHLWKPGQSGNPAGRPPGTSKAHELREQIRACVPDVVTKLMEQAKGGDVGAARLLLERVLPAIKPMELPQSIALPAGGDLTAKGHALLQAAADGEIPAPHAASLMTALGSLAKVAEVDELARRVAALEDAKK